MAGWVSLLVFLGSTVIGLKVCDSYASTSLPGGALVQLVIPGILAWIAYAKVIKHQAARQTRQAAEASTRAQEQRRSAEAGAEGKRRALTSIGAVVYVADGSRKMVRCSNNHRFMFCDFQIGHSAIARDRWDPTYYTDYWAEMGCPACKSNILFFEERPSVMFRACDQCKCAYNVETNTECPSCARR